MSGSLLCFQKGVSQIPYLVSYKDWWYCSAVVESEHVIEAEETSWTAREEVENLSELDRVLTAVNEEISRDEAENAVVDWGLSIEALNLMLNLTEGAELVNDAGHTLELFTLKAEHGVIGVQFLELL